MTGRLYYDPEGRLIDACWLIRELEKHEGSEGFSKYLNEALEDFHAHRSLDKYRENMA